MRYALLPVLLAAGVASCDSTNPTNPLTELETIAVLRELVWLADDEIIQSAGDFTYHQLDKLP